ncbi:GIY-YIG nuclease family protein [Candidatus Saccharibacteria bacterium]|nr:GIY-YIG nuclease family protein [Candidatus Saccharibacteria bacterium]
METILIIIGILLVLGIIALIVFRLATAKSAAEVAVDKESIGVLAEYVMAQKEQAEAEKQLKELRRAEQKQKLETFKQTKEVLKEKLQSQIEQKDWRSLSAILQSADKGGVGIYIIYNETKDKYYVGQAKQLFKRVRDHFKVEDMAKDLMAGDKMSVKFLTTNEIDANYRLDHIETTFIEIFDANKSGYNKTTGNL